MANNIIKRLSDAIGDVTPGQIALVVIPSDEADRVTIELATQLSKQALLIMLTARKGAHIIEQELVISQVDTRNIFYLDCLQCMLPANPKILCIKSAADLTAISIAVTEALLGLRARGTLLIDSLSTLLIYNDPDSLMKFVHATTIKIRNRNAKLIILAQESPRAQEFLLETAMLADKVIRL